MLKTILYMGAFSLALVIAPFSPILAAVVSLESYLMHPVRVARELPEFRYQFWAALVFIFTVIIHQPRGLRAVANEARSLRALWVYAVIGLLTPFWALVDAQIAFENSYEFAKTILLASLLILVIRNERDLKIIMWASLIGVLHAAFMHTVGVDMGWVSRKFGRELGVLADSQGAVMILFLPVFMLLTIYGKGRERWFAWLAIPFVMDSIVSTYRRTFFVSLILQFALLIILLPWQVVRKMIVVLGVGVVLFVFVLTPQNYWDWMSTLTDPEEEGSAASRWVINDASWRMLKDYPMGVGYRNYPAVSPQYLDESYLTDGERAAHSTFFTVACETGVLGFAAWATAIVSTMMLLRTIRRRTNVFDPTRPEVFAMGIEIGMYGWLVSGLFHSANEVDPVYWFVALAVTLFRMQQQAHDRRSRLNRVEDEPASPLELSASVA